MAVIDRYVVDGGAGVADGTSWADAWSIQTAFSNFAAGMVVHVEGGTYTVGQALTTAVAGGRNITSGEVARRCAG